MPPAYGRDLADIGLDGYVCGGYEGLHRWKDLPGRAGALATFAQAMSKDLGVGYRKNLGGLFDMTDGLRHPISWSPQIWSGSCSPVPRCLTPGLSVVLSPIAMG